MDKKALDDLVVRKQGKTTPVTVRVPDRVIAALEAKNINVADTVRNVLLRLADK